MGMKSYVIKPLLNKSYPMVSHGKGVYVYDAEGKGVLRWMLGGCDG